MKKSNVLLKLTNRFQNEEGTEAHYPSIGDFINEIKRGDGLSYYQSHDNTSSDWWGSSTFEEAYPILEGFNNKVDEIKLGLEAIRNTAPEYIPQANRFSGRVNVAAMLSGVENCRVRVREEERDQPMVTIYVQMNALSDVSSTNFVNKAVAIANAVHELEKAGKRVELVGYSYSIIIGNSNQLVTIKVKSLDSTLSLGQLYGAFAPSTFRRLIFRHIEMFWKNGDRVPEGYGTSLNYTPPDNKAINIPRDSAFNTLKGAVEFVNSKVKQKINE